MELWLTLSSQPVRWPRPSEVANLFQVARIIAKGEVLLRLMRRDTRACQYLADLSMLGCHVLLDLPGSRLQIASTVSSTELIRAGRVMLVDETQAERARSGVVPVRGLRQVLPKVSKGLRVWIADGAVAGTVTGVSQGSARIEVVGDTDIDLQSRSLSIEGVAPPGAPTESELSLIRDIIRDQRMSWLKGVLVSFAERVEQVDKLADLLQARSRVVPKLESAIGLEAAAILSPGCARVVVGRSDLRVGLDAGSFAGKVTDAVRAIARARAQPIVASGVAESLLHGPELSAADLNDLKILDECGTVGLMLGGSVSELIPIRAGSVLRGLYP